MKRNTTQRNRDREAIARTRASCGICGEPIDYALPHLDPRSFVVDHIVPMKHDGRDDLSNKQPAHRDCNQVKAAALDGGKIIRRSGSIIRAK